MGSLDRAGRASNQIAKQWPVKVAVDWLEKNLRAVLYDVDRQRAITKEMANGQAGIDYWHYRTGR
jgi:hypothetical protein